MRQHNKIIEIISASKKRLFVNVLIVIAIGASFWLLARHPFFSVDTSSKFINIIDESGIEEMGGVGASWSDYNNDGFLDLFTQNLYRNNSGDGTFSNVSEEAGFGGVGEVIASVFGDYDNDGCSDIYISRHGPKNSLADPGNPDVLYHNNCDGTFADVTENAGIHDSSHGFGVAWADYNKDGYLDLYVANWGILIGSEYAFEPNILYRNNGDGTFTDVTEEAGVIGTFRCGELIKQFVGKGIVWERIELNLKHSYQPVWFDYNNDGNPDLFVATDTLVSPLYRNNGDGTFTDVTEEAGLCKMGTGMGVAVADYDGNGHLDIYVTNTRANYLWRNNGNGAFTEVAGRSGAADRGQGWGTAFLDYNNDGNMDIYVVNGTDDITARGYLGIKPNNLDELLRNNGNGIFSRVTRESGISGNELKKGAGFADFNNDGFVDMFVLPVHSAQVQPPFKNRFYKNLGNSNSWLTIQLVGTISNRDGIGARIVVRLGETSQIREVMSGDSFLSQSGPLQTFGLGSKQKADSVEVTWPSGIKQTLSNIRVNQKIVVTEGE